MEAFLEETRHLKIPLEEIISATNKFDNNNLIGKGGFGKVYKGVLSHSKEQRMVAFKRLDRSLGQGNAEFLREILMLSHYTHENLISLLGFCDEDDEKILVYEHAYNGSLDGHLSDTTLTWRKRLNICLMAAKGLCYLHDPKGTAQRVIHRDIKSSNILLDESWNAKVSDMGLSKVGPANQQRSFVATNVVGTYGYIDPLYMETYFLTKESDVYSFGMVLFEVLCGRLCFEYNSKGQFRSLWPMWKKSYEEKKLSQIIFEDLKEHMNPSSLETFSEIAYRCLQKSREERPAMSSVVKELEIALQFQKMDEPMDYEDMSKSAVPPLVYKSKEELQMLLYTGMLVNGGKTWFSLNKNGEHCEMISAAVCVIPVLPASPTYAYNGPQKSRFQVHNDTPLCWRFKVNVKAQFLSPDITYAVNLVFGIDYESMDLLFLDYKSTKETYYSTSYTADKREDGWFMTELYQFTSVKRSADFDITFDCRGHPLIVEGIEFLPVDTVEHQVLKNEEVDMPDTFWEQKLPSDYEDILKWSKDSVEWTTKKELYFVLCKGFLIKNRKETQWFYLSNDGKKCYMLLPRMVLQNSEWNFGSSSGSRFEGVAHLTQQSFSLTCTSQMLSPDSRYACYLVYSIATKDPNVGQVVEVSDHSWIAQSGDYEPRHILLFLPGTPIIRQEVNDNTSTLLKRTKMVGVPQRRKDGWLEVQVWKCETGATASEKPLFDLYLNVRSFSRITALTVKGVEIKAI